MIARVTKLTHAKNTHIQGLTVLSLYTLPEYSRLFVNFVFCLYSFCLTLILQWMFVGKITFYLHQLISVKPGKQVWCKDTLSIQKQKNCMYNNYMWHQWYKILGETKHKLCPTSDNTHYGTSGRLRTSDKNMCSIYGTVAKCVFYGLCNLLEMIT